jgi:TPR repeat protein
MHRKRLTAGLVICVALAILPGICSADPVDHCPNSLDHGDEVAAIKCLQALADAGNRRAEMLLGAVYGTANLQSYDAARSAYWTRKAAEHGEISAQVMIAYLYREGKGVPKDPAEAMKWYRTAADSGDQLAQFNLGLMYFRGWGTRRDVVQALDWERKAADQHGPVTATAEASIAGIYLKGDGVPRDYAEAARWFRRAAEHGSPGAYFSLAQMDEKGLAGSPDPSEAYVGYSIALAWLQDQHSPAQLIGSVAQDRDDVAAKLTAAQKLKADRVVRDYRRSGN